MKAERYLSVDKREFLLQVLVVRVVQLLKPIFLVSYILGVVEDLTGKRHSREFAVLKTKTVDT